ncbi:hypothetical protein FRC08_016095 [Ceratobasidium sp. 394]|nr:hypothetical protein FRC08_016095 [Ceratobasidium sp. 394]
MASQPTTRDKPRSRCRVQGIKLEPNKSEYDIAIEIQVDGTKVRKLSPIKKGQHLHWTSLSLPCDVHEDSVITLQVTEVRTFQDRVGRAEYQMSQVVGQDTVSMSKNAVASFLSSAHLQVAECNNGIFDTHLEFLTKEATQRAYSEAFARAQQMERQPGLLEKVGRVGDAFKVLLSLGSTMSELDPTGGAKVAFSLCTKAWEYLETQEKQHAKLCELVENIAGMIPSVESIRGLADANLAQTVMEMLNLIEDVSLFVLNFKSQGSLERAFRSAFSSTAQEQMDLFVSRFKRLRGDFDTRVQVQTLRAAEIDRIKKELRPVDQAGYDPIRQCIAGTRVEIIDKLVSWAQRSDDGPRLTWAHGLAGLGKSAIATSVCMRLDNQGLLAASFFCKRDNPELRDPRRVITTIVYELASRWEAYRNAVAAVIRDDARLSSKHIQPLYDALVSGPLRTLDKAEQPKEPLVIVIDALDECGDTDLRRQLLACLRDMSQQIPRLRLIATSRPDADIKDFFVDSHPNWFARCDLFEFNASDDIRVFVRDSLKGLAHLDGWPEDAIEQISIRSSGLFIWARTACKFILDGFDRCERLERILAGTHMDGIDVLYTTAIEASIPDTGGDNTRHMLKCLGAIVATASRTPLSATNLAALLQAHISLDVLNRVLGSLSSVLYVDQKLDNTIRIYHPSFMDFITTQSRSKHLCVDLEYQNMILAESCFRVMAGSLKFNICGLETSNLPNNEVMDLDARVRDAIHPHMWYSCLYWSSHVVEANLAELERPLRSFLFGLDLVYWLEVLSLLGKLSVAPACLLQFIACCSTDWMQDCNVVANDAYRFVLTFYDVISTSTPHLYVSALAFAPENSEISQRMRRFFPKLLTVTQGAENAWTRCLRRVEVTSTVLSVAIFPNSRRIVSGSGDGTVRIWDAETGDPVLEPLKGHTEAVLSVAFSPNGRWIASGSADKTIRIWDAETGEARLDPLHGHTDWVRSVAFSPNSCRVVSGSDDKTIRVGDAETGKLVLEPLEGHAGGVWSVAFSPNSQWIISGSDDCTLRIWDAQTGAAVREPLKAHSGPVMSLAFSLDSRRIASCSIDTTVRIWDVETGKEAFQPLRGHSDWVRCIAFSPDSKYLVSGSFDRTVRIWDTQTGDLVLDTLDGHSHYVRSVAFSSDGRRVVSGSEDKTIRIWDVVDKANPRAVKDTITSKGHSGFVNSVGFSSNGRYVVSGSSDKTVRIWDAETGAAVRAPFEGHSDAVLSVAFSPDDHWVASGSRDGTVRIWNADTGESVLEPLRGHSGSVQSVAFSPDGHRVASGSADGSVCIWDAETGAQSLSPLEGHSRGVNSVVFSPNGRRLASGSDDHMIRIWDTETGQLVLKPLTGHSSYVMSVAFSADGHRIVSGSADEMVRIWDAETGGTVLDPLQGHTGWVRSVAFSSDGRWIASGSEDETMRIWDARTGEAVLEPMRGHSNLVLSVAFSPDCRRIASGSVDMTVRIWDAESHTTLAVHTPTFLPGTQVRALPSQVTDGKLLVTSAQLARHMHSDLAGWVTSTEGKLLVWLPPELRDIDDSLVSISGSRVRHQGFIDFGAFVHGSSWASIADV